MIFKKYLITNTVVVFSTSKKEALEQFYIYGNDFGRLNQSRYKVTKITPLTKKEIIQEIKTHEENIGYFEKDLEMLTDPKEHTELIESIKYEKMDIADLEKQLEKI